MKTKPKSRFKRVRPSRQEIIKIINDINDNVKIDAKIQEDIRNGTWKPDEKATVVR